jgi:uncharacterized protein
MVFKRRDKPPLLSRIRHAFLPRTGWRRGIEYLGHRIQRLPDTPHRIALGVSCGVFASFTPFFGLHFILAVVLAKLVRGNILASLIGTFAGNPLTFPFIASLALGIGRRILGYGATGRDFSRIADAFEQFFVGLWDAFASIFGYGEPHWGKLTLFVQDVLWPYLVGGVGPGLIAAVASYFLARPVIAAYQMRRRARVQKREQKLAAQLQAKSDTAGRDGYAAPKKPLDEMGARG